MPHKGGPSEPLSLDSSQGLVILPQRATFFLLYVVSCTEETKAHILGRWLFAQASPLYEYSHYVDTNYVVMQEGPAPAPKTQLVLDFSIYSVVVAPTFS